MIWAAKFVAQPICSQHIMILLVIIKQPSSSFHYPKSFKLIDFPDEPGMAGLDLSSFFLITLKPRVE